MIGRTRVKVCGVRDAETAEVAAEAGADAVGFIFVEGSPRCVDPDEAAGIMLGLGPLVSAVAVTRDLSVDEFAELEQVCPANLSQLHGKETEKTVAACGPGVIKGFRFDPATIDTQLDRWGGAEGVDAVLIDGSEGGEGRPVDWPALAAELAAARERGFALPVFLAGGLTPDNVGEAIAVVRPFAVDVSSGVESAPGVKDHGAIRAFCQAVTAADAARR